jgi:predicted ATPase
MEEWRYKFINTNTVSRFLTDIEGNIRSENGIYQRANSLLETIAGQTAQLFYVKRLRPGREANEEIWELILADTPESPLPPILKLKNKTLSLRFIVKDRGNDTLLIKSTRLLPVLEYQPDFTFPCYIKLVNSQYSRGIPFATWQKITTNLPLPTIPTEEQLQAWEAFLEIEERLALSKQFFVPFVRHNYGTASRNISFEIVADQASVDSSQENRITAQEFWQRAVNSVNNKIYLVTEDEAEELEELNLEANNKRNQTYTEGRELGEIQTIDQQRCLIRIHLESEILHLLDNNEYQLPNTGYLSFQAFGDRVQIKRKRDAITKVKNGEAENPALGEFLFNVAEAKTPAKIINLNSEDLLLKTANPSQISAVKTVLSAPDFALIQGPPGTGKTTVIAEICYQVALRGGRTLVASQAHLAVDNALSRLIHNPVIRAVRKGNQNSVNQEGEAFLEANVVNTWLTNTAHSCEQKLLQKQRKVNILQKIGRNETLFTRYVQFEAEFTEKTQQEKLRKDSLEQQYRGLQENYTLDKQNEQELQIVLDKLSVLKQPDINWFDFQINQILTDLQDHYIKHQEIDKVQKNIRFLIEHLQIIPPQRELLAQAGWLEKNSPLALQQVKTTLSLSRQLAELMVNIDEQQQRLQAHKDGLINVENSHQNNIKNIEKISGEIDKLNNRQLQISLALNELQKWLLTTKSELQELVTNNIEISRFLPENFIKLPPYLLSIKSYTISYSPWIPPIQNLKTKINAKIQDDINLINAREKSDKLERFLDRINFRDFQEKNIDKATDSFQIYNLPPNAALDKLDEIANFCQQLLNKRTNLWGIIAEGMKVPVFPLNHWKLAANWDTKSTLESVRRQAERIKQRISSSPYFNINYNVDNFISEMKTSVSEWLDLQQQETQQEINCKQGKLYELQQSLIEQEENISLKQQQLKIFQSELEQHNNVFSVRWQQVINLSHLPRKIKNFTHQYQTQPFAVIQHTQEFIQIVNNCETIYSKIEDVIPSLSPLPIVNDIEKELQSKLYQTQQRIADTNQIIEQCQNSIASTNTTIEEYNQQLQQHRNWWEQEWINIPETIKPEVNNTDIFNLEFLRIMQNQFQNWKKEIEEYQSYLTKYETLISDYVVRLRNHSQQDRRELHRLYLDNANVIGITCSQSASRRFLDWKAFDVVIIDEVSKCTPPEILIPALKAKKLVLVGDHRQLPPMLNNDTLEELAAALNTTEEELGYLRESLFKQQFEVAPDSIKTMLNIQYRMHPQIMSVINQFYDYQLQCGLVNPDQQRAHYVAGEKIKDQHHIIWWRTPTTSQYRETRDGTSFYNQGEVSHILEICKQINAAWLPKMQSGREKKEIGIITFYVPQLKLIENQIHPRHYPALNIRTGTVDRFQGMERQIVIVSLVRNNENQEIGFAKKPERINVAFSRAQELLIIVGCESLFTSVSGKSGTIYANVSNAIKFQEGLLDVF